MVLTYTAVERIYDIEPELREVSDLTSAQVVKFAEDAEAEINGAVARFYVVPVLGGPPLLTAVATDIAIYRILSRRVFTQERMKDSTWPDRFKESRDILAKVASGEFSLVDSVGTIIGGRTDVAKVI